MTQITEIERFVEEHQQGALFSVERGDVQLRGKVRDIIPRGETLIMVNTDRVSAFDRVFGTIPLKGALLAEQACFWFELLQDIVPHHVVDRPDPQIMVVKKAEPFLVEVVVRGYLAGSLMREHPHTRGHAYGLRLDPSLKNYQRLEEPIITPSTKAEHGLHDEPISPNAIVANGLVSKNYWHAIEEIAKAIFRCASEHALKSGLLLVDTKYEFGLIDGVIHLIDEVHTADSSRFFLMDDYSDKISFGQTPTMLDKEFLRQYLITQGENPSSLAANHLILSDTIRQEVAVRYFQLTECMMAKNFSPPQELAHNRVHQALARLIC